MNDLTKPKERSRAYPVLSLEEALKKVVSINENLGAKGQFNRETIARGMGYSSLNGASARAVAALTHYGFLNRERDQYSLSLSAVTYLLPMNDDDKENVVREAALAPTLFSEIYEAFQGQVIPRQFTNRLIHEFGIQQKAAPEVERIFRSVMLTGGILQSNGVLDDRKVKQVTRDISEPKQPRSDGADQSDSNADPVAQSGYLSVKLPSELVVSYSQDLASAFAFGSFGEELKKLDDAVTSYKDKQNKNVQVKVVEGKEHEEAPGED